MNPIWAILGIAWAVSGMSGFVFWWTKDWDLTFVDLMVAFGASILGPFAWGLGSWLHGDTKKPLTIMKKRGGA